MTAYQFQVTLKWFDKYKTIDYTKVPLALVNILKWDTYYKIIVDDCAYACPLHLV